MVSAAKHLPVSGAMVRQAWRSEQKRGDPFYFFFADFAHAHPTNREPGTILNRGKWLGSPANIKGANKEAKIEVGKSITVHIFCFALIIHYA